MKIIKEEVIKYFEKYESFDGTIFEDKEECMKYETSAYAMLRKRILDMCSSKNDAWKLMGGYEDNQVLSIQVNNQREIDTIIQWFYLQYPYYAKEEYQNSEYLNETLEKIKSSLNDILLIGVNENDDWYIINSRKNIVNNLQNL